jgi:sugar phosphate isomerase/epimerase
MKLGIMADAFRDRNWEEACKAASELGLKAIEPVTGGFGGDAHCRAIKMLKDEDEMKRFKKTAQKYDLEISGFSCHSNPLHPDKEIAEKHIADIEASMIMASKLEVPVIILFAGLPGAGEGAKYPNWITHPWPVELSKAYEWQWGKVIIPFWTEMAKKAKKLKIKFGFEMEPGDSVYSTDTFLRLRESVGMEEIACNLDPGHLFYQGMDLELVIRSLGKSIIHAHIKDAKIEESVVARTGLLDARHFRDVSNRAWNYATVGYGHDMLFWKKFVSTLRLVGYDGVLSLENENTNVSPHEGLIKSVEFMKQVVFFENIGKQWWEDFK